MTRNHATFLSTVPDDAEESESGDVLIPAGHALAKAIAERIPSAGLPHQHSFYGWRFEFKSGSGRDAWALLQQPGPWLLIVEARVGWLESGSKKAKAHEEAVELVRAAMSGIPQISDVIWLAQDELTRNQRMASQALPTPAPHSK